MDDALLVKQAIDAIKALEDRLEQLKPGITSDSDNVLPDLAPSWKAKGFPKVGLAVLQHMMACGSDDLISAATAWEFHRDAIKKARAFYPVEYPGEPLRLALWEYGLANYRGFMASTSCADVIDQSFSDFWELKTTYYGEDVLQPNDKQKVISAAQEAKKREKRDKDAWLANLFFNLYLTNPKCTKTDDGYAEAAEELAKQGVFVGWRKLKEAVENSEDSIWADIKEWGVSTSTMRARKKDKK